MGQSDVILDPVTQEQVDDHFVSQDSLEFYTLLDSCVIDLNNRHNRMKKLANKIGHKTVSEIIYLLEKSSYSTILYPMIDLESGWNDSAYSYAGAIGIAQIMPRTAREYGMPKDDLYDPVKNVTLAIQIFEEHIEHYHYIVEHYALTAYNKGRGGVKKYGAFSGYSQTILRAKNLN